MTSAEIAGLGDPTIVILPVAATEQHGPHLPTGTDSFILAGILAALTRSARRPRPSPCRCSPSAGRASMAICRARSPSMRSSWLPAGSPLALPSPRRRLKRLLILNSHGGNPPPIALAAMRLRAQHGLLVVHTHWEALAEPAAVAPAGAPAQDWHAGWIETSVMLHLRPELVALDKASRREMRFPEGLPPDGPAPWAWMTTDLNPSGVIGDPRLASAALGAQLVESGSRGVWPGSSTAWPRHPGRHRERLRVLSVSRRLGRRLGCKIVQPAQLRGGLHIHRAPRRDAAGASTGPSIAPP